MENKISLYEVYNILINLSAEKNAICSDYAKKLAHDLDLEVVLFKKINNVAKKEVTLYVKSKDDIGNDFFWREVTIVQKDNGFISKSPNAYLELNLLNANIHLQQLFKKLEAINDYLNFNTIKLVDTTKSCNIILSSDSIKIRRNNGSFIIKPLDFYKNNNIENKGNLEDLLKSIYIYKTDIPEWILKRCALENAITLEKVVKKLKLGLKNFMSI